MRDFALTLFLFGALPFVLWRPAIGIFLWVWVSVMSPHRLTWGFAHDFRFAQLIAIATLIGILLSREPKRMPVTPVTVTLLLFVLWMNVTTAFALNSADALPMWERVMKIQIMVFAALYVLHSKLHIQTLLWILAGSVAFYGVKGGLFTLGTGGDFRVWGPPGSFIDENNGLALALVMTIPLLRYLQLQSRNGWVRWSLVVAMLLCGVSVVGSHSRGALLAVTAMLLFLWLKGRNKLMTGLVVLLMVPLVIGFMPEKWEERMGTIQNYEQDGSAMGRINSWMMIFNLTMDRPVTGGGFEPYTQEVFHRYAPDPTQPRSSHSIYFQALGEHGYVGLALFLLVWLLVWRDASWVSRHSKTREDLQWAGDLARMIQVSLVGYAVGGTFLNLAYYDVPYNLLVTLVLTRLLVAKATADRTHAPSVAMPKARATELPSALPVRGSAQRRSQ